MSYVVNGMVCVAESYDVCLKILFKEEDLKTCSVSWQAGFHSTFIFCSHSRRRYFWLIMLFNVWQNINLLWLPDFAEDGLEVKEQEELPCMVGVVWKLLVQTWPSIITNYYSQTWMKNITDTLTSVLVEAFNFQRTFKNSFWKYF